MQTASSAHCSLFFPADTQRSVYWENAAQWNFFKKKKKRANIFGDEEYQHSWQNLFSTYRNEKLDQSAM